MTGSQHVTTELVDAVARAPFDSGRAGCPWDAVAPIHQYGLRARALSFLGDAIPVMLAQGWRPPTVKIANREQLEALPVGSAIASNGTVWQSEKRFTGTLSAADVVEGREVGFEVIWGCGYFGIPHRSVGVMAKMGLPAELILVGTDRS